MSDRDCPECSVCEGEEHHYLEDEDELSGEPIITCKHCDWQTDMTEEWEAIFNEEEGDDD